MQTKSTQIHIFGMGWFLLSISRLISHASWGLLSSSRSLNTQHVKNQNNKNCTRNYKLNERDREIHLHEQVQVITLKSQNANLVLNTDRSSHKKRCKKDAFQYYFFVMKCLCRIIPFQRVRLHTIFDVQTINKKEK